MVRRQIEDAKDKPPTRRLEDVNAAREGAKCRMRFSIRQLHAGGEIQ
jgi:hypothetical protein